MVGRGEYDLMNNTMELAKITHWHFHHDLASPGKDGRWRVHVAGPVGFPDLLLARDGIIHVWEFKGDHEQLRPGQPEWGVALGGVYRLLRPADWPWIHATLTAPRAKRV